MLSTALAMISRNFDYVFFLVRATFVLFGLVSKC